MSSGTGTGTWGTGIQTAKNCPRTREFTEAYSKRGQQYGWEWSPTCPLCRRTLDEIGINWLDYHHWQKDPDIGICFCRTCHDDIDGGDCDTNMRYFPNESRDRCLNRETIIFYMIGGKGVGSETVVCPGSAIDLPRVRQLSNRMEFSRGERIVIVLLLF